MPPVPVGGGAESYAFECRDITVRLYDIFDTSAKQSEVRVCLYCAKFQESIHSLIYKHVQISLKKIFSSPGVDA